MGVAKEIFHHLDQWVRCRGFQWSMFPHERLVTVTETSLSYLPLPLQKWKVLAVWLVGDGAEHTPSLYSSINTVPGYSSRRVC